MLSRFQEYCIRLIFVLIILFIFSGCNTPKEIIFPTEKVLTAIEYPIPDLLIPNALTIKENHLILLQSSPPKGKRILSFFHLPKLSFTFDYGTIGRGKDEFIVPMLFESSYDTSLYLWGNANLQKIVKYAINAPRKKLDQIAVSFLPQYESFNQAYLADDSTIIYNAMPMEFSIKKINLNTGEIIKKLDFKKQEIQEPYYEPNRVIIASNSRSVAACYVFQKRIDIYDTDLNLKRTISSSKDSNLAKIRNNDYNNVVSHYANIYLSSTHIYALYRGKTSEMYKKTNYQGDIIEVFDLDGNPIVKYSFDKSPVLFIIDETSQKIYGYNSLFENKILVYNLI